MDPLVDYDISTVDPFGDLGRSYFELSLKLYLGMLEDHPWSLTLLQQREVLIVEVMGGSGLGSTALAKALSSKGVHAGILIADTRGRLLRLAERWGSRLGIPVQVVEADPFSTSIPGEGFNMVLLHGYSSSLIDPWRFSKLLARMSWKMSDDGVLVARTTDHLYRLAEGKAHWISVSRDIRGNISLSIMEEYDPVRGVIRDIVLKPGESNVEEREVSPWSLASLASLLWLFFRDVDVYPRRPSPKEGFLLMAYRPRRVLTPRDLEEPSLLRRG